MAGPNNYEFRNLVLPIGPLFAFTRSKLRNPNMPELTDPINIERSGPEEENPTRKKILENIGGIIQRDSSSKTCALYKNVNEEIASLQDLDTDERKKERAGRWDTHKCHIIKDTGTTITIHPECADDAEENKVITEKYQQTRQALATLRTQYSHSKNDVDLVNVHMCTARHQEVQRARNAVFNAATFRGDIRTLFTITNNLKKLYDTSSRGQSERNRTRGFLSKLGYHRRIGNVDYKFQTDSGDFKDTFLINPLQEVRYKATSLDPMARYDAKTISLNALRYTHIHSEILLAHHDDLVNLIENLEALKRRIYKDYAQCKWWWIGGKPTLCFSKYKVVEQEINAYIEHFSCALFEVVYEMQQRLEVTTQGFFYRNGELAITDESAYQYRLRLNKQQNPLYDVVPENQIDPGERPKSVILENPSQQQPKKEVVVIRLRHSLNSKRFIAFKRRIAAFKQNKYRFLSNSVFSCLKFNALELDNNETDFICSPANKKYPRYADLAQDYPAIGEFLSSFEWNLVHEFRQGGKFDTKGKREALLKKQGLYHLVAKYERKEAFVFERLLQDAFKKYQAAIKKSPRIWKKKQRTAFNQFKKEHDDLFGLTELSLWQRLRRWFNKRKEGKQDSQSENTSTSSNIQTNIRKCKQEAAISVHKKINQNLQIFWNGAAAIKELDHSTKLFEPVANRLVYASSLIRLLHDEEDANANNAVPQYINVYEPLVELITDPQADKSPAYIRQLTEKVNTISKWLLADEAILRGNPALKEKMQKAEEAIKTLFSLCRVDEVAFQRFANPERQNEAAFKKLEGEVEGIFVNAEDADKKRHTKEVLQKIAEQFLLRHVEQQLGLDDDNTGVEAQHRFLQNLDKANVNHGAASFLINYDRKGYFRSKIRKKLGSLATLFRSPTAAKQFLDQYLFSLSQQLKKSAGLGVLIPEKVTIALDSEKSASFNLNDEHVFGFANALKFYAMIAEKAQDRIKFQDQLSDYEASINDYAQRTIGFYRESVFGRISGQDSKYVLPFHHRVVRSFASLDNQLSYALTSFAYLVQTRKEQATGNLETNIKGQRQSFYYSHEMYEACRSVREVPVTFITWPVAGGNNSHSETVGTFQNHIDKILKAEIQDYDLETEGELDANLVRLVFRYASLDVKKALHCHVLKGLYGYKNHALKHQILGEYSKLLETEINNSGDRDRVKEAGYQQLNTLMHADLDTIRRAVDNHDDDQALETCLENFNDTNGKLLEAFAEPAQAVTHNENSTTLYQAFLRFVDDAKRVVINLQPPQMLEQHKVKSLSASGVNFMSYYGYKSQFADPDAQAVDNANTPMTIESGDGSAEQATDRPPSAKIFKLFVDLLDCSYFQRSRFLPQEHQALLEHFFSNKGGDQQQELVARYNEFYAGGNDYRNCAERFEIKESLQETFFTLIENYISGGDVGVFDESHAGHAGAIELYRAYISGLTSAEAERVEHLLEMLKTFYSKHILSQLSDLKGGDDSTGDYDDGNKKVVDEIAKRLRRLETVSKKFEDVTKQCMTERYSGSHEQTRQGEKDKKSDLQKVLKTYERYARTISALRTSVEFFLSGAKVVDSLPSDAHKESGLLFNSSIYSYLTKAIADSIITYIAPIDAQLFDAIIVRLETLASNLQRITPFTQNHVKALNIFVCYLKDNKNERDIKYRYFTNANDINEEESGAEEELDANNNANERLKRLHNSNNDFLINFHEFQLNTSRLFAHLSTGKTYDRAEGEQRNAECAHPFHRLSSNMLWSTLCQLVTVKAFAVRDHNGMILADETRKKIQTIYDNFFVAESTAENKRGQENVDYLMGLVSTGSVENIICGIEDLVSRNNFSEAATKYNQIKEYDFTNTAKNYIKREVNNHFKQWLDNISRQLLKTACDIDSLLKGQFEGLCEFIETIKQGPCSDTELHQAIDHLTSKIYFQLHNILVRICDELITPLFRNDNSSDVYQATVNRASRIKRFMRQLNPSDKQLAQLSALEGQLAYRLANVAVHQRDVATTAQIKDSSAVSKQKSRTTSTASLLPAGTKFDKSFFGTSVTHFLVNQNSPVGFKDEGNKQLAQLSNLAAWQFKFCVFIQRAIQLLINRHKFLAEVSAHLGPYILSPNGEALALDECIAKFKDKVKGISDTNDISESNKVVEVWHTLQSTLSLLSVCNTDDEIKQALDRAYDTLGPTFDGGVLKQSHFFKQHEDHFNKEEFAIFSRQVRVVALFDYGSLQAKMRAKEGEGERKLDDNELLLMQVYTHVRSGCLLEAANNLSCLIQRVPGHEQGVATLMTKLGLTPAKLIQSIMDVGSGNVISRQDCLSIGHEIESTNLVSLLTRVMLSDQGFCDARAAEGKQYITSLLNLVARFADQYEERDTNLERDVLDESGDVCNALAFLYRGFDDTQLDLETDKFRLEKNKFKRRIAEYNQVITLLRHTILALQRKIVAGGLAPIFTKLHLVSRELNFDKINRTRQVDAYPASSSGSSSDRVNVRPNINSLLAECENGLKESFPQLYLLVKSFFDKLKAQPYQPSLYESYSKQVEEILTVLTNFTNDLVSACRLQTFMLNRSSVKQKQVAQLECFEYLKSSMSQKSGSNATLNCFIAQYLQLDPGSQKLAREFIVFNNVRLAKKARDLVMRDFSSLFNQDVINLANVNACLRLAKDIETRNPTQRHENNSTEELFVGRILQEINAVRRTVKINYSLGDNRKYAKKLHSLVECLRIVACYAADMSGVTINNATANNPRVDMLVAQWRSYSDLVAKLLLECTLRISLTDYARSGIQTLFEGQQLDFETLRRFQDGAIKLYADVVSHKNGNYGDNGGATPAESNSSRLFSANRETPSILRPPRQLSEPTLMACKVMPVVDLIKHENFVQAKMLLQNLLVKDADFSVDFNSLGNNKKQSLSNIVALISNFGFDLGGIASLIMQRTLYKNQDCLRSDMQLSAKQFGAFIELIGMIRILFFAAVRKTLVNCDDRDTLVGENFEVDSLRNSNIKATAIAIGKSQMMTSDQDRGACEQHCVGFVLINTLYQQATQAESLHQDLARFLNQCPKLLSDADKVYSLILLLEFQKFNVQMLFLSTKNSYKLRSLCLDVLVNSRPELLQKIIQKEKLEQQQLIIRLRLLATELQTNDLSKDDQRVLSFKRVLAQTTDASRETKAVTNFDNKTLMEAGNISLTCCQQVRKDLTTQFQQGHSAESEEAPRHDFASVILSGGSDIDTMPMCKTLLTCMYNSVSLIFQAFIAGQGEYFVSQGYAVDAYLKQHNKTLFEFLTDARFKNDKSWQTLLEGNSKDKRLLECQNGWGDIQEQLLQPVRNQEKHSKKLTFTVQVASHLRVYVDQIRVALREEPVNVARILYFICEFSTQFNKAVQHYNGMVDRSGTKHKSTFKDLPKMLMERLASQVKNLRSQFVWRHGALTAELACEDAVQRLTQAKRGYEESEKTIHAKEETIANKEQNIVSLRENLDNLMQQIHTCLGKQAQTDPNLDKPKYERLVSLRFELQQERNNDLFRKQARQAYDGLKKEGFRVDEELLGLLTEERTLQSKFETLRQQVQTQLSIASDNLETFGSNRQHYGVNDIQMINAMYREYNNAKHDSTWRKGLLEESVDASSQHKTFFAAKRRLFDFHEDHEFSNVTKRLEKLKKRFSSLSDAMSEMREMTLSEQYACVQACLGVGAAVGDDDSDSNRGNITALLDSVTNLIYFVDPPHEGMADASPVTTIEQEMPLLLISKLTVLKDHLLGVQSTLQIMQNYYRREILAEHPITAVIENLTTYNRTRRDEHRLPLSPAQQQQYVKRYIESGAISVEDFVTAQEIVDETESTDSTGIDAQERRLRNTVADQYLATLTDLTTEEREVGRAQVFAQLGASFNMITAVEGHEVGLSDEQKQELMLHHLKRQFNPRHTFNIQHEAEYAEEKAFYFKMQGQYGQHAKFSESYKLIKQFLRELPLDNLSSNVSNKHAVIEQCLALLAPLWSEGNDESELFKQRLRRLVPAVLFKADYVLKERADILEKMIDSTWGQLKNALMGHGEGIIEYKRLSDTEERGEKLTDADIESKRRIEEGLKGSIKRSWSKVKRSLGLPKRLVTQLGGDDTIVQILFKACIANSDFKTQVGGELAKTANNYVTSNHLKETVRGFWAQAQQLLDKHGDKLTQQLDDNDSDCMCALMLAGYEEGNNFIEALYRFRRVSVKAHEHLAKFNNKQIDLTTTALSPYERSLFVKCYIDTGGIRDTVNSEETALKAALNVFSSQEAQCKELKSRNDSCSDDITTDSAVTKEGSPTDKLLADIQRHKLSMEKVWEKITDTMKFIDSVPNTFDEYKHLLCVYDYLLALDNHMECWSEMYTCDTKKREVTSVLQRFSDRYGVPYLSSLLEQFGVHIDLPSTVDNIPYENMNFPMVPVHSILESTVDDGGLLLSDSNSDDARSLDTNNGGASPNNSNAASSSGGANPPHSSALWAVANAASRQGQPQPGASVGGNNVPTSPGQ